MLKSGEKDLLGKYKICWYIYFVCVYKYIKHIFCKYINIILKKLIYK